MLIRRVPAVVLTVAILFTTVFALSISASALTFTPRYSMPNTDNEYYYSSKNPFYSAGYGLPNCTAYAYGRIYEITGKRPNLSTGNAENWYGYNQSNGYYEYGQTPRLGAIACWSYGGSGGHVAVVEYMRWFFQTQLGAQDTVHANPSILPEQQLTIPRRAAAAGGTSRVISTL